MPGNSRFTLKGPAALGALTFLRLQGDAALSAPFDLTMDFFGTTTDSGIQDLLGQAVHLSIAIPNGSAVETRTESSTSSQSGNDAITREWDGVITHARQISLDTNALDTNALDKRGTAYQVRVEPRLALLRYSSNTRFFNDQTVVQVVQSILTDYNVDFNVEQVRDIYPAMQHCTQYRESDFDFVSRLLEREGIHYYFDHRGDRHTMVLSDGVPALAALGQYDKVVFRRSTQTGTRQEGVYEWSPGGRITQSRVTVNDYDFKKPSSSRQQHLKSLAVRDAGLDDATSASFIERTQGGGFVTPTEGERYARIGVQRAMVEHAVSEGSGELWGLNPGAAFVLIGHPVQAYNKTYRVTSASWKVEGDSPYNRGDKGSCHCHFSASVDGTPFRPARRTPVPRTTGPETAFVVGPTMDQIHTDQYGRIKVAFHWEGLVDASERNAASGRGGTESDDGSGRCWVRVMQAWAGKQWGTLFLPRVGQEVIVDFLGGNPDCPIVTGSVYNASTMPPFTLPANASIATLRSKSLATNGGSNELRFKDEDGKEQLFMRAEKDFETYIKHDELTWVGGDQHRIVAGNQAIEIDGVHSEQVKGNASQSVGGKLSLTVTESINVKAGQDYAVESGGSIHVKAGGDVVIEAGTSITLKVGGAFIVIGSGEVTVTGAPIKLNSGGSAGTGVGSTPAAPDKPLVADDGTKKLS